MANNKTTYVLEIDAEIKSLKAKLEGAKESLEKIGQSNFSNSFDKKINGLMSQLERLQRKAGQPIDSKATFSSIEKGFNNVIADSKSLIAELDKISKLTTKEKLSILPEDEASRLKSAINAVQIYTKAVEKAEKARVRGQEKRRGELSAASASLAEAKKNRNSASAAYSSAIAKGTEYSNAKAIIAQAEAAEKAQKEIDQLEKKLKKYQKRLEELNKIEERSAEQNAELETTRSNVRSVGGKIGAKTKVVKNAPDEKTVNAAKSVVEQKEPEIEKMSQQVQAAEKEVARLEGTVSKLEETIKSNSTQIVSSQADYKVLYEQAKKLGVSLEGITEDVSSDNIKTLNARLNELVISGISPADQALEEIAADLTQLGVVAQTTGDQVAAAGEKYGAIADDQGRINNIKENIKQFIGWAGASKVLSAAIRNAFNDIKELDAVMTEIAVVTDFDIGDMWEQLPQYTQRANDLGLAITEVYEASALYYQQGLDTNEMVALSNETLKMAKIAGLDAAEATDRMTAALRGFNMELDEASAQKVADVYSKLAAITAADVDEISSAMTKTASIASSAGMEFETTAAFLSQIIETTRESAETAGTAMKTVIARFQELKKAPDEIGEIDGEIVDANQIEKALRSVGVSLRDASGQFRELDEVFLELSGKWDSLDKNTQRYIATIAAGSRQQSRFIAMMSDYERTQELVTAANNSAGASQKQYEKTLESIETKLKRLENAWTEFSTGLMNSDLVKSAIDFLTKLLNAINKITQGFEGLTGSLSKIGTMVAIFQTVKVILSKFWDEIVMETVKSVQKAMKAMNQEVKAGVTKTKQDVDAVLAGEADGGVEQSAGGKKVTTVADAVGVTQLTSGYQQMKNANSGVIQAQQDLKLAQKSDSFHNANTALEKKQIQIKQEKRAIQNSMKGEKDKYKIQEAQKSLNALEEKELDIIEKKKELSLHYTDEEIKNRKTVADAELELQNAQKASVEASKDALNTMAQGAQKAGQAIAMVGVGLGVVGQMFEEAGNSEAAQFFTEVGNIFTFVGSAIMGVAAIIPGFVTIFGGLVAKMVAGGISVQAAWWWVVLIVAAVVALVALIVMAVKAVQNASPEAKLERAQEAADKAAKAADRAKESYEDLKNAFEGLENGYKALEDLTRGTDEWNQAVQNINKSVLDLIEQYPELAKLVDNEGGVLTIDINSGEAQKILKDAQASSIKAANASVMAGINVARAEDNVARNKLKQSERIGHYEQYGDTSVWVEEKENTEALAKALASGTVINTGSSYQVTDEEELNRLGITADQLDRFYKLTGNGSDALKDFGESLLQTQKEEEAAFSAIAASAQALADTMSMSEQELAQASNIVDNATAKAYYDEEYNKIKNTNFTDEKNLSDENKEKRDEAIKAQYGADARIEGNKVTYRDAEGKQQTEELTNEEIQALIANNYATESTAAAVEMAPQAIDQVIKNLGLSEDSKAASAIEKAAEDREGGEMTNSEVDALLGMSTDELKKAYNDLSDEQKKIFGSEQDYLDKIQGAAKIANNAFEKAKESANHMGIELQGFMTSDMAKGFIGKMEEVYATSGAAGVQKIQEAYNSLIEGQTEEVASKVTAAINATDWTNADDLLGLQIELEEQYGYTKEESAELVEAMKDAANATSSLVPALETFGELYHATNRLNAAMRKTADLQWDYERILKKGADATELAANLEQQRQSILTEGAEALKAYDLAREKQMAVYGKGGALEGVRKDVTKYIRFDESTGTYDYSELQRQINAGEFGGDGSDERKVVEDYISELEEANEYALERIDLAKDAYEKLEELNEIAEESYWTLYEQVGEMITAELEKEIEVQQDILDATQSANDKLLNKLQEQIDGERQDRENEQTEKNIADLQNQAAYLGMDSSGANALQLLDLEKQIADEEQAYYDTLIDQSIQELQDANDKAAEQRERQIALQEQQVDLYKNSESYWNDIQTALDGFYEAYNESVATGVKFNPADTALGKRMEDAFTQGMSEKEKEEFWKQISTNAANSTSWYESNILGNVTAEDGGMLDLLTGIETNTQAENLANITLGQNYQASKNQYEKFVRDTGLDFGQQITRNEDGSINYSGPETQAYMTLATMLDAVDSTTRGQINTSNQNASTQYSRFSSGNQSNMKSASAYYAELSEEQREQLIRDFQEKGKSDLSYEKYITDQYNSFSSQRSSAIASAGSKLNNQRNGGSTQINSQEYKDALALYKSYGGTEESFKAEVKKKITGGSYDNVSVSGADKKPKWWDEKNTTDNVTVTMDGTSYKVDFRNANLNDTIGNASGTSWDTLMSYGGGTAGDKWIAAYNNNIYMYREGIPGWLLMKTETEDEKKFYEAYFNKLRGFKTGGLADFTGPAWLDGTPSRPEYILNSAQTERFFSLVDILEGYDTDKNNNKSSGDNYFDIEINVEKLENDYDVEKVAEKIRNMIYNDATYRNVNAINHIR